jgi:hypothetical protein
MLYLTIAEGDDPERAVPILGTTDADLIRGMADLLRRRLGGCAFIPVRRVPTRGPELGLST